MGLVQFLKQIRSLAWRRGRFNPSALRTPRFSAFQVSAFPISVFVVQPRMNADGPDRRSPARRADWEIGAPISTTKDTRGNLNPPMTQMTRISAFPLAFSAFQPFSFRLPTSVLRLPLSTLNFQPSTFSRLCRFSGANSSANLNAC
jgi:hypothetical protein